MKTYIDCIPCFIRQTLEVARMVTQDQGIQEKIMREALQMAHDLDFADSPPGLAQKIHRRIRALTGKNDPYSPVKTKFNQFALDLYPEWKKRIKNSGDPFATALKVAIAGNIIDFGVNGALSRRDVLHSLDMVLDEQLDPLALESLRNAIRNASDILYLGDNAGEIVMDRMFIEQILPQNITYVVRGFPILNDATRDDAEESGLTELVEVIDNGSDAPGTILEDCSEEFKKRFENADIVIAKGQGNYETLNTAPRHVFFLLKAKCPVIARDIGCQQGDIVIVESNSAVYK